MVLRVAEAAVAESSGEVRQLESEWAVAESGRMLARTAVIDMAIFYAVLLVGFAYVWYRGDLDWVRAVASQRASELTNAGTKAVAPGRQSTSISFAIQARTSRKPGSEIAGVPASETIA